MCIRTALTVAMLLVGPTWVLAQVPVAPVLDDSTGSSYAGTPRPRKVLSCFVLTLVYSEYLSPLSCAAGASAPEPLPTPSQDPTNSVDGPVQAPVNDSNTTIIVAPEAGLGAILGNNGSAINTTIVQQLTFTGKAMHQQCLPRAARHSSQHQQVSRHMHFACAQETAIACACPNAPHVCLLPFTTFAP